MGEVEPSTRLTPMEGKTPATSKSSLTVPEAPNVDL